jgi:hypothetical protein
VSGNDIADVLLTPLLPCDGATGGLRRGSHRALGNVISGRPDRVSLVMYNDVAERWDANSSDQAISASTPLYAP